MSTTVPPGVEELMSTPTAVLPVIEQEVLNTFGQTSMYLPLEALEHDIFHPLAYLYAHARAVQPWGIHYLIAALVILLFIGRQGRNGSTEFSNKVVTLTLSFMWSSHACLILSDSCRSLDCNITYWSLAVIFGFQSLVYLIGGTVLNRFTFVTYDIRRLGYSRVVGTVFLVYTFLSSLGHHSSSGAFFLLAFPLDAFTAGLFLACGQYVHVVTYVLPLLYSSGRSLNSLGHYGLYGGEWSLAVLSAFGVLALLLKYLRPPEKKPLGRGSNQGRGFGVSAKRSTPECMLQEIPSTLGREQGNDALAHMLAADEDGDEAHEFFEATDDGGFVSSRAKLIPKAGSAATLQRTASKSQGVAFD